ncbi:MAG: GNAT family N-acetyltransferase [Hormoscilla sp. GUM202]|nr:GNAT family N-acetyltransferase [Hormoscilla sp. GUM202]
MEWIFFPLDGSVNRDNFDCGIPELNEYLQKYARQNHRKGIAITFIAISETASRNVADYYSVSMAEIRRESLPENYRRGLPRYPLPAMRIAQLAVDITMQGRGLGKELLMQCFKKAVRLSSEVGIFAVTVDAFDKEAKAFYLRYGLIPLEDNTLSLFIPMRTILNVLP